MKTWTAPSGMDQVKQVPCSDERAHHIASRIHNAQDKRRWVIESLIPVLRRMGPGPHNVNDIVRQLSDDDRAWISGSADNDHAVAMAVSFAAKAATRYVVVEEEYVGSGRKWEVDMMRLHPHLAPSDWI